jgi:ATP adenylyltransferase
VSLYCFENVRTAPQLAEMRRLEAAGECLFCPDVLARHNTQQVLMNTTHWTVTPNAFPYPGTALHLLLVPGEHVTDLLDLSPAAREDFWTVLAAVRRDHRLTYYGLGIRNGDCRYTGATIRHVHAHVLVGPSPDHPAPGGAAPAQPIRMRFSSRPDQALP